MRLITNRQVADTLLDYYKEIVFIDYLQQTLLGYKAKLLDNLPVIFKSADYALAIDTMNRVIMPLKHVYLASADPLMVNRILIEVNDIGTLSGTIRKQVEEILGKNMEIEKLIGSNYYIEKK